MRRRGSVTFPFRTNGEFENHPHLNQNQEEGCNAPVVMKKKTLRIAYAAIIAALYVALTLVSELFGMASGMIQFRLSEALTVLPFFTAAAIPGLSIGCLLANPLTGSAADALFGTLATLLGAIGTFLLARIPFCKKKGALLCTLPPIIFNILIIPPVLKYAYGMSAGLLFLACAVAIGEIVCCGLLGGILLHSLRRSLPLSE